MVYSSPMTKKLSSFPPVDPDRLNLEGGADIFAEPLFDLPRKLRAAVTEVPFEGDELEDYLKGIEALESALGRLVHG